MRYSVLMGLVILPGVAGVIIFGVFALIDWFALLAAYEQFEMVRTAASLNTLLAAEAQQNIHRINLFAEGTWVLLSGILTAIGIHGLCVMPRFGNSRRLRD